MKSRITTIYLIIGVLLSVSIFVSSYTANVRLPDNHQGYEPVQPIAFSHRLHAGEMGMQCLYCHFGAEKSKHAGIPPVNVCMNCHKYVSAPFVDTKAEEQLATKENRKPR
ncbi:MAG: cytochrome c3 family protein, partial [Ignavibacteriales bacterium]|nr:cytochrome c3 family protein [Ignavibacteriales bacterium]